MQSIIAATVETQVAVGKGEAAERSAAIQEALVEAVSKVAGVTLDAASATALTALEKSGSNGKSEFQSEESFNSEVKKRSKGLIEKWEVLKEENSGGRWKVELTVSIFKIVGGNSHDTRKTLAVLPFRVVGEPSFMGTPVGGGLIGNAIRESLVSYLTSGRKFAVLDETFSDEVARQQGKNSSNESPIEAALREANKLGAQFVVTGIAEGIKLEEENVTVGNQTAPIRRASGILRVRVIRVDSGQTVLASETTLDKLPGFAVFGKQADQSLAVAAGQFFSNRILDTIYPIKVSSVNENGEIIIDRGGEGIKKGNIFGVFKVGKELRDESTGEKLGVEETKIAEIEITRVEAKVSYANLIGKPIEVPPGSICRRLSEKQNSSAKGKVSKNPADDLFK